MSEVCGDKHLLGGTVIFQSVVQVSSQAGLYSRGQSCSVSGVGALVTMAGLLSRSKA